MKTLKKIFILFVLIFLYMFVLTRGYYPETIAVKGEEIKISDIQVIPVGEVIGIKLYTSGVLVVGTSEVEGIDGQKNKPYANTGIQEGDSIISVNDIIVNNTEELIDAINLQEAATNKLIAGDCMNQNAKVILIRDNYKELFESQEEVQTLEEQRMLFKG